MRLLIALLRRLWCCTSGSTIVEATIVIPMMISLMAGGVDFGIIMSTQATVDKSVRDATRYLATVPANAVCGINPWGLNNAKSLAVYGKLRGVDGVDTPLVSGWAMDGGANNNVELGQDTIADCANILAGNCASGCRIQLQASVPYASIFLTFLFPNVTTWTLSTNHEERHIGA
jgi:TadE-like protein